MSRFWKYTGAIAVLLFAGTLVVYAYGTSLSALYIGTSTPGLSQSAGTLEVDGAAQFDGAVTTTSTLTSNSGMTLHGTLSADTVKILVGATINGNITIGGSGSTVTITKATGTLVSKGILKGDTLQFVRQLEVGSTVTIAAASGDLTSLGTITGDTLTAVRAITLGAATVSITKSTGAIVTYGPITGTTITGSDGVHTGYMVSRGVGLRNSAVQITDGGTPSSKWTQTVGTGWTVALGSGNGRDGSANVIHLQADATADDAATYNYGATLDLTSYNWIGFWVRSDNKFDANEWDWSIADNAGTLIGTAQSLGAGDTTGWQYAELYIGGTATRSTFRKFNLIHKGTTAQHVDIAGLQAYEVSNGKGPCNGNVELLLADGTLTAGDIVCRQSLLLASTALLTHVGECAEAGTAPAGIVCDTDSTATAGYALVETQGVAAVRIAHGCTVSLPMAPHSATTIFKGAAGRELGYALESGSTATVTGLNRDIYILIGR